MAAAATVGDPAQTVVGNGEAIAPLPQTHSADLARAALGGLLFHDRKLSKDGTTACADCHDLAAGGVDGKKRSVGVGGAVGGVNAPTVFNAAFNFR